MQKELHISHYCQQNVQCPLRSAAIPQTVASGIYPAQLKYLCVNDVYEFSFICLCILPRVLYNRLYDDQQDIFALTLNMLNCFNQSPMKCASMNKINFPTKELGWDTPLITGPNIWLVIIKNSSKIDFWYSANPATCIKLHKSPTVSNLKTLI